MKKYVLALLVAGSLTSFAQAACQEEDIKNKGNTLAEEIQKVYAKDPEKAKKLGEKLTGMLNDAKKENYQLDQLCDLVDQMIDEAKK